MWTIFCCVSKDTDKNRAEKKMADMYMADREKTVKTSVLQTTKGI